MILIAKKEMQVNEQIRDKQVRVIGNQGEQLGVMSAKEAYSIALSNDLDLVKISPNASPAVCKIMDYGKYKFMQQKRDKEAKKNQKVTELKEVRMSLNIDKHDFDTKLRNAIKFLKAGNKVKVSVRFRGREMAHRDAGHDIIARFVSACEEYGTSEGRSKMEGRNMGIVVAPKVEKNK